MSEMKISVLGAGAWGMALAIHLARNTPANVHVWDRNPVLLEEMSRTRITSRPRTMPVPETLHFCPNLVDAVHRASYVLSVVPSYATAHLCQQMQNIELPPEGAVFINCSKGIDPETLRLPWEIFLDAFAGRSDLRYAVLAGPSHAEEVVSETPTAVVASAPGTDDAKAIQNLFYTPRFRVYLQNDYRAVELGGALKNVMAIAAGICDGQGYGDNTKAAFITRALAEMTRLAIACGSDGHSMAGLSGLGDLIVTTMSRHSRNHRFGELLTQGYSPQTALAAVGAVVEGYLTTKSVWQLAHRHNVEMPLAEMIYQVLYENLAIDEAVRKLLNRRPSEEGLA